MNPCYESGFFLAWPRILWQLSFWNKNIMLDNLWIIAFLLQSKYIKHKKTHER